MAQTRGVHPELSDNRRKRIRHQLTPQKARQILHDKEIRGHPLTERQRRFFGAVASGQPLRRARFHGTLAARRRAARRRAHGG